jgi:hypothetical protein
MIEPGTSAFVLDIKPIRDYQSWEEGQLAARAENEQQDQYFRCLVLMVYGTSIWYMYLFADDFSSQLYTLRSLSCDEAHFGSFLEPLGSSKSNLNAITAIITLFLVSLLGLLSSGFSSMFPHSGTNLQALKCYFLLCLWLCVHVLIMQDMHMSATIRLLPA